MHHPRAIVRREVAENSLPADMHPLLRRIFAARGVTAADELDYRLAHLATFEGLSGVDAAADVLATAVTDGRRILVVADYDTDGATGCALALRGLRAMGAGSVDYLVPDRARHGYGLSAGIVADAAAGEPDLIITVDNGIASFDGAAAARERGIDLLITDHHLPGETLPPAAAIVNPNLPGDPFPGKSLAGVGVMFYLLAALRARLRAAGWFADRGIADPNLAGLLDLVALGTVADMVPLDRVNRTLVAQGLARIRAGRAVPGIRTLMDVARRSQAGAGTDDLAFAVAPRINAAGRLTDMRLGIDCLIEDDPAAAANMAKQLDALNRERRQIQARMQAQAMEELDRLGDLVMDAAPAGISLYDDRWHPGVVGVLASQVRERINRPVFVFAPDGDGVLKGSGRSVDGVHIRDVLVNMTRRVPDLIQRFGGHAMAAGLSMEARRFDEFAAHFAAEVAAIVPEGGVRAEVLSDGELAGQDLTLSTAELVQNAGPWGQGFPEPVFDGEFAVKEAKTVGDGAHLKLQLSVPGQGRALDAIGFGMGHHPMAGVTRIRAAYRLGINTFAGRRSFQLVMEHLETG